MNTVFLHSSIICTIVFGVCSQTIIKWQMSGVKNVPSDLIPKFLFLLGQFANPWILFAMSLTLLSGVSWMLAMSKFDISYAYSFLGLNFILTFFVGVLIFKEPFLLQRLVGVFTIALGLYFVARAS